MDTEERIGFGKHSGKTIEELVRSQKSYCEWFFKQVGTDARYNRFKERLRLRYDQVYSDGPKIAPVVDISTPAEEIEWEKNLNDKILKLKNDEEDDLPELDSKQKQAADTFLIEEKSICLLGMAGSGKSVVIRHIRSRKPKVVLVAPTWLAAANIGGDSIHRAFRIKPGIEKEMKYLPDGEIDPDWLAEVLKMRNRKAFNKETGQPEIVKGLPRDVKAIIRRNGIIIDEISMVSGKLFEFLDRVLQYDFDDKRPFGGCQLMVVGDFAQLSPIDDVEFHKYAFQTPVWKTLFGYPSLLELPPLMYMLNICHRQDRDGDFYKALRGIRTGEGYDYFKNRIVTPESKDYFEKDENEQFFWLMPTNAECEVINQRYLNKIPGISQKYPSIDFTSKYLLEGIEEPVKDSLDKFTLVSEIDLKVGAKVRLVKSLEDKRILYNGQSLRIIGMKEAKPAALTDDLCKESLQAIRGDLMGENGKYNKRVLRELEKKVKLDKYPVLVCVLEEEFKMVDRSDPRPLLDKFDPKSCINLRPYLQCKISYGKIVELRIQYPIRLGYAITVHRAQGLTLGKTVIGTERLFAGGQFYTALSREKKVDDVFLWGGIPKVNNIEPVLKEFIDLVDLHSGEVITPLGVTVGGEDHESIPSDLE